MDLKYDGTIEVELPAVITTVCEVNVKDFPFDKKICEIQYARY
jgi:hypothetical protein